MAPKSKLASLCCRTPVFFFSLVDSSPSEEEDDRRTILFLVTFFFDFLGEIPREKFLSLDSHSSTMAVSRPFCLSSSSSSPPLLEKSVTSCLPKNDFSGDPSDSSNESFVGLRSGISSLVSLMSASLSEAKTKISPFW